MTGRCVATCANGLQCSQAGVDYYSTLGWTGVPFPLCMRHFDMTEARFRELFLRQEQHGIVELERQHDELWRQVELARAMTAPLASVVYYAQRSDDLIKIGYSCNLDLRMASLQKEHGLLKVLATEPGEREQEQRVHRRFRPYRAFGEWFFASPPLLEHIAQLRKGATPKALESARTPDTDSPVSEA